MKTKKSSKTLLITAAVVFATAAVISVINTTATKPSQEAPQTKSYPKLAGTWTYDCEFPVQRPLQIMLTCADGGMFVTDISWKTWTETGATGTGTYSQNMCDPNCAEGTRVNTPVSIKLSGPFAYKGRNLLKTLDIQAVSGRELPNGGANMTWDVSEFAVRMNWDVEEEKK